MDELLTGNERGRVGDHFGDGLKGCREVCEMECGALSSGMKMAMADFVIEGMRCFCLCDEVTGDVRYL